MLLVSDQLEALMESLTSPKLMILLHFRYHLAPVPPIYVLPILPHFCLFQVLHLWNRLVFIQCRSFVKHRCYASNQNRLSTLHPRRSLPLPCSLNHSHQVQNKSLSSYLSFIPQYHSLRYHHVLIEPVEWNLI